jgi:hypothetical protein
MLSKNIKFCKLGRPNPWSRSADTLHLLHGQGLRFEGPRCWLLLDIASFHGPLCFGSCRWHRSVPGARHPQQNRLPNRLRQRRVLWGTPRLRGVVHPVVSRAPASRRHADARATPGNGPVGGSPQPLQTPFTRGRGRPIQAKEFLQLHNDHANKIRDIEQRTRVHDHVSPRQAPLGRSVSP